MSDYVKKFQVNGYTVKIVPDDHEDAGDPRDADNLGVMLANGHRNYTLGDEPHQSNIPEYGQAERIFKELDSDGTLDGTTLIQRLKEDLGATVVLPLYLLDHSGLAMRTGPFWEDPGSWDSGIVGFIFDTPRTREMCGTPPELIEKALTGEVEDYNRYLQGEVYGYVIQDPDGKTVESVWGFLGDEYVKEEATSTAEALPVPQWVVVKLGNRGGVEGIHGPYAREDADADAEGGGIVMLLQEPFDQSFPLYAGPKVVEALTKADSEGHAVVRLGETLNERVNFRMKRAALREKLAEGWLLEPSSVNPETATTQEEDKE